MLFEQKLKTSSFDIVVREPLGFGEKWLSEPWVPKRKDMPLTQFLTRTQWDDDTFIAKERCAMPWAHR